MFDAVARAKEIGFELASSIDVDAIATSRWLAESCSPKTCRKFGTCWSCPPGAGSFEELQAHFEGKDSGVLVQTMREGVDFNEDFELMMELHALHNERLDKLAQELRQEFTAVREFTTGGCGLCNPCTYPDAPCRKPEEQRYSISAHGIDVDKTCKNVGMEYSFENGRIRYVGIILYSMC